MAKLLNNYIYNLAGQILIILTPLLTTPYISRVLGADNIGIYSYTLSISIYFIIIGNLGFPLYGQREIAYSAESQEKINQTFYEIFYGQILTLGIAFICYIIFVLLGTSEHRIIYLAQGIGVFASLINIGWLYQGLEEFRIIVVRNLFIKTFFIICLFIFVRAEQDLLLYTLIINFANLLGNAFIFWGIRKYITVTPSQVSISLRGVCRHFKSALILGIPFYITSVYSVLDKTMIGNLTESYAQVGFFEQSQKIVMLAITIVIALGTVIMPRLSAELGKDHIEKSQKLLNDCISIVLLLSMPIMVGVASISDNLVPWFFGPGFEEVENLLLVFAPLAVVMGLSNLLGNQYMVAAKMEKSLGWVMFIGLLLNLFLNFILIPPFMAVGASLSTMVAEVTKLGFFLFILRRTIDMRRGIHSFIKYLICSGVMGCGVVFSKNCFFVKPGIFETLMLTGIGIIYYFIVLFLVKDELFNACFQKVSNRVKKQ